LEKIGKFKLVPLALSFIQQQAGPDTGCLGLWTRVAESAESAPKLQSIDTI
jgi:hypothetical protein